MSQDHSYHVSHSPYLLSILLILKRLASFSLYITRNISKIDPAQFSLHWTVSPNALEKRSFGPVWVRLVSLGHIIEAEGRRKIKNYDIAAATANVNLGGGAIPRNGVLIEKPMMSTIHIFI